MFTVIETRDFFEGIFGSREEADQYLFNHPEKESCRLVDLSFGNYPLFVLEIGRGKFKYFPHKDSLVAFFKETGKDGFPKSTSHVFYVFDDPKENYDEDIIVPGLTLYVVKEPYMSNYVNQDGIGVLDHHHFQFEDIE